MRLCATLRARLFGRDVLRHGAQQVPAVPEALPQLRRRCPDQSPASVQHPRRYPRLLQSPLGCERRQCQHDHGANYKASNEPEYSTQETIEPSQPDPLYRPACQPPYHPCQQDDGKKDGEEPRNVRCPLRRSHNANTMRPDGDIPRRQLNNPESSRPGRRTRGRIPRQWPAKSTTE